MKIFSFSNPSIEISSFSSTHSSILIVFIPLEKINTLDIFIGKFLLSIWKYYSILSKDLSSKSLSQKFSFLHLEKHVSNSKYFFERKKKKLIFIHEKFLYETNCYHRMIKSQRRVNNILSLTNGKILLLEM